MRIKLSSLKTIAFIGFLTSFFFIQQGAAQEWRKFYGNANIDRFRADNIQLGTPTNEEKRVVFMGNSIVEAWPILTPSFFENDEYIVRGISGQTTPQMLLRFRTDVISIQAEVVIILAGVNDIAQNTGFIPIEIIAENIMTMAELAKYHNIEVIICSVVPAIDFPWRKGLEPANKIVALNLLLKDYAAKKNFIYVDYHSAMADKNNGLKVPDYTEADDLVHPNEAGYTLMGNLIKPAIEQALAKPKLHHDENKNFASGPRYKNHRIKKNKIVLDFHFKGTGLVSNATNLEGFEIAGEDKKFVSATAIIKRNKVYLSAKKISRPKYVRYTKNNKGLECLWNRKRFLAPSFIIEK